MCARATTCSRGRQYTTILRIFTPRFIRISTVSWPPRWSRGRGRTRGGGGEGGREREKETTIITMGGGGQWKLPMSVVNRKIYIAWTRNNMFIYFTSTYYSATGLCQDRTSTVSSRNKHAIMNLARKMQLWEKCPCSLRRRRGDGNGHSIKLGRFNIPIWYISE